MSRQVFKDDERQKQFEKDGYVVVDLMNEKQQEQLFQTLKELEKEKEKTGSTVDSSYKLSFFSDSPEYRKKVFSTIAGFFQPLVNQFLQDYEPLIINTFDKEPGTGEVPVHQNWTFVDESQYTSLSIWIPLIDVSRENGALEVVRGSHRVLTQYRSPSIPWVFKDLADTLKEKYMESLNLSLGQVGIIDDSILHYSSVNNTDTTRSSIQLIMKPSEAPAIHYYRDENNPNELEIFEVDSDFFTTFQMDQKPQNVPSRGKVPYQYYHLSEEELVDKVAQNNPAIRSQLEVSK